MEPNNKKKEIKLKINDNELKGTYANQVAIMHSKYDFVVDFIAMFPPEAIVNARIITNPASFKRMYNALTINLQKYEAQYGEIAVDDEPEMEFPGKIN